MQIQKTPSDCKSSALLTPQKKTSILQDERVAAIATPIFFVFSCSAVVRTIENKSVTSFFVALLSAYGATTSLALGVNASKRS